MSGPDCSVCIHPELGELHRLKLEERWPTKLLVGRFPPLTAVSINRHFHAQHPGPPTGEPGSDAVEIPPDATPVQKLRIVTGALERKIRQGRARSDEIREYRIALKDLHGMEREADGPRAVQVEDVEGLPELLEALMSVAEAHPAFREAFLAEVRRRGLEGVLG